MKHIVRQVSLICLLILMLSNISYADKKITITEDADGNQVSCSITKGDAAIDGVHIGEPDWKIKGMLGEPTKISDDGRIYYYKNSGITIYMVKLDKNNDRLKAAVKVVAYGGDASTPKGVTVGMPESVLKEQYGDADLVQKTTYETPNLPVEVQLSETDRRNTNVYVYRADKYTTLTFLAREGFIRKIFLNDVIANRMYKDNKYGRN